MLTFVFALAFVIGLGIGDELVGGELDSVGDSLFLMLLIVSGVCMLVAAVGAAGAWIAVAVRRLRSDR